MIFVLACIAAIGAVECERPEGCHLQAALTTIKTIEVSTMARSDSMRVVNTCQACKTIFHAPHRRTFCNKCLTIRRTQIAKEQSIAWKVQHECEHCGKTFPHKNGRRAHRFCSRECAFAAKGHARYGVESTSYRRAHSPELIVEMVKKHGERERKAADRLMHPDGTCLACGELIFTSRPRKASFCGPACERTIKRHSKRTRACPGCGRKMNRQAITCDRCSRRRHRHLRRARLAGVASEPFTSREVFIRDGWRCQLCGRKVREYKHNHYRANRATLDHIVPIGRQGNNTMINAQCACHECNSRKSARIEGQTRLF